MPETTRESTRPAATVPVVSAGARRWDIPQWGPIFAGLIVTVAALVLLTLLGVAVGLTADPVLTGDFDLGVAATVWGVASAVVAFLAGGVVAGSTAARSMGAGGFHGAMVGVFAVAAITLAAAFGLGNLLGAGAANLGQIAEIAPAFETQEAVQFAQAQSDDAQVAAWATFFSLVGAIVVAAIGGGIGGRSAEAATADETRPTA